MEQYEVDLEQFDEEYQEAELPEQPEFSSVPDGKYHVIVDRVELKNSNKTGSPMLKWGLKIIAGPYENRLMFRNNIIATVENLKWLKQDLNVCGMVLDKLSDLKNRLEELLDITLEVSKKTKNGYENVYLVKRVAVSDMARGVDMGTVGTGTKRPTNVPGNGTGKAKVHNVDDVIPF